MSDNAFLLNNKSKIHYRENQPAEVLGNVDSIDIDQHDIANETDFADSWVRYATHHRGGGRKDSSHP